MEGWYEQPACSVNWGRCLTGAGFTIWSSGIGQNGTARAIPLEISSWPYCSASWPRPRASGRSVEGWPVTWPDSGIWASVRLRNGPPWPTSTHIGPGRCIRTCSTKPWRRADGLCLEDTNSGSCLIMRSRATKNSYIYQTIGKGLTSQRNRISVSNRWSASERPRSIFAAIYTNFSTFRFMFRKAPSRTDGDKDLLF